MAAQTDRLLGRARGPGSAHSTDPPPQFHWEAITLTSWHSLHSSWVCFFARENGRVRREDGEEAPDADMLQQPDALKGSEDERLAQHEGYFDMQKIYKTFFVTRQQSMKE